MYDRNQLMQSKQNLQAQLYQVNKDLQEYKGLGKEFHDIAKEYMELSRQIQSIKSI
jgi:hypothetical protein